MRASCNCLRTITVSCYKSLFSLYFIFSFLMKQVPLIAFANLNVFLFFLSLIDLGISLMEPLEDFEHHSLCLPRICSRLYTSANLLTTCPGRLILGLMGLALCTPTPSITSQLRFALPIKCCFLAISLSSVHDLTHTFLKRLKLLGGKISFQKHLVFSR